jgi:hypothetical protein
MGTVVALHRRPAETAEEILQELRLAIMASARTYEQIGKAAGGLSATTIHNIASDKTKWPRPSTLFPLASYFGFKITLSRG